MCERFRLHVLETKADAAPKKPREKKPTGPRYVFQPDGSVVDMRKRREPLLKPRVLTRQQRAEIVGRINRTRTGSATKPPKLPRARRDTLIRDELARGSAMEDAALRRRGIRPKPRTPGKVTGSGYVYGPQDRSRD